MNSRILYFLALYLLISGFIAASDGNKEKRELQTFTDIEFSGAFDVKIIVGEEQEVIVETKDEDDLDKVITRVRSNSLVVELESSWLNNIQAKVYIKVKTLESLQSSGANSMKIRGIDTDRFKLSNSGAGTISIEGEVNSALFNLSGASSLDAKELIAKKVRININGASNAKVYASEELEGEVSGVANLDYYGHPEHVDVDDSGLGNVNRK